MTETQKKKPFYSKWWFLIFVLIVVFLAGLGLGNGDESGNSDETKETAVAPLEEETETADDTAEVTTVEQTKPVEAEETKEVPEETEDDVPMEYRSALKKAESYATRMNMSKNAIYDQLVSEHGEQFPEDAAQYAIDNLDVDYKELALEKAKSYAERMNMSKSAVYDQLISEHGEQFTAEEAQYAIDNLE